MGRFTVILLALALAGSWLWFATATRDSNQQSPLENKKPDEVVVWVNEHLGSPDEAHYCAGGSLEHHRAGCENEDVRARPCRVREQIAGCHCVGPAAGRLL